MTLAKSDGEHANDGTTSKAARPKLSQEANFETGCQNWDNQSKSRKMALLSTRLRMRLGAAGYNPAHFARPLGCRVGQRQPFAVGRRQHDILWNITYPLAQFHTASHGYFKKNSEEER